tara:strand:+ start:172 stop:1050 length:879 start_codon:yes stop_codon:yes gene_type:complete
MQKIDFSELSSLLESLKRSIPESSPPPVYEDYSDISADQLHTKGFIKKGESRYIIAGEVPCSCDFGYRTEYKGNVSTAYPCKNCYQLLKSLQRIQRAHLPNDSLECSLDQYIFDSAAQKAVIREMITTSYPNQTPSLFMYGGAGNGKTTISYILAKYLCLNGYRVKYIHHYHEFQKEKKSWSSNQSHLDQLLDNVDVLIFDEFGGLGGRSSYSDWFINTTIELIGIMYEKFRSGQLSIILTSNMNPNDIFKKLLDQNHMALSRLENIFGNPLFMKGPDRRPKGNQVSKWIQQ